MLNLKQLGCLRFLSVYFKLEKQSEISRQMNNTGTPVQIWKIRTTVRIWVFTNPESRIFKSHIIINILNPKTSNNQLCTSYPRIASDIFIIIFRGKKISRSKQAGVVIKSVFHSRYADFIKTNPLERMNYVLIRPTRPFQHAPHIIK